MIMLASEMREWSNECSTECDAETAALLRAAEAGRPINAHRLMMLCQISILAYAIEAVSIKLEQIDVQPNGKGGKR